MPVTLIALQRAPFTVFGAEPSQSGLAPPKHLVTLRCLPAARRLKIASSPSMFMFTD